MALLLVALRRGADPGIVSGFMIATIALACAARSGAWGMGEAMRLWPGGSALRDPTRWLLPYSLGLVVVAWHADWTRRTVQGVAGLAVILILFLHADPRGIYDQLAEGMRIGSEHRWAPREVDVALLSLPPGPIVEVPMGPGDGMLLPSTFIHGRKLVNGYARFLPKAHRSLWGPLSKDTKAIPTDVLRTLDSFGVHTWVLDKQKLLHPSQVSQSLIDQGLILRFHGRDHLVLSR